MFSCMARFQPMPNTSVPTPARKAATTSPTTWGETPRTRMGRAIIAIPSMPRSSGRSSRTRSSTRVMTSSPIASADST